MKCLRSTWLVEKEQNKTSGALFSSVCFWSLLYNAVLCSWALAAFTSRVIRDKWLGFYCLLWIPTQVVYFQHCYNYVLFIFVCVQKIAIAWTGMVERLLERLRTNHAWFWTKVVDAIAVCMCTCKRDGVSRGERWCWLWSCLNVEQCLLF